MHCFGLASKDLCRLKQFLRGLMLAFGINDLGAPLALRFGLTRDRTNHRFVDVDVLDLDIRDLDAPGIGLAIEYCPDVRVQFVALSEHLIKIVLAEDRAQRGLSELAHGVDILLHLDDGALRVDHMEIDDGIDVN